MAGGVNVPIGSSWNPAALKQANQDISTFRRIADSQLGKIGLSFVAAGAAAGTFAAAVGVMSVRAAMEDEQSVGRLATTLKNLGLAHEQAGVESFIDQMQFSSMFADNDLRPAYDRLVRSTRDVGEAQDALQIAMDIAQAKGKTVVQVSEVLAKAYSGNTQALGRLGTGLDKTTLKTGDMKAITAELAQLFSGQASAGVDNLSGKFKLLNTGLDELQESFGKGIVTGFFDELDNGTNSIDAGVDSMRAAQPTVETFGKVIGSTLGDALGWMRDFGLGAMKANDIAADSFSILTRAIINTQDVLGKIGDEEADAMRRQLDAEDASRDQAMANYVLATSGGAITQSLQGQAAASADTTEALNQQKRATEALNAELERSKKILDHISARSSVEGAIDAFAALDTTETKSWTDKHGKTQSREVTKQFFTDWNPNTHRFRQGTEAGRQGWEAAKALIDATIAEAATEGPKAARKTYAYGRRNLIDQMVGINVPRSEARIFARDLLSTPGLGGHPARQPAAPTSQSTSIVNHYTFGDVMVPTPQAATIWAQQEARLAAISDGGLTISLADRTSGRGVRRSPASQRGYGMFP